MLLQAGGLSWQVLYSVFKELCLPSSRGQLHGQVCMPHPWRRTRVCPRQTHFSVPQQKTEVPLRLFPNAERLMTSHNTADQSKTPRGCWCQGHTRGHACSSSSVCRASILRHQCGPLRLREKDYQPVHNALSLDVHTNSILRTVFRNKKQQGCR